MVARQTVASMDDDDENSQYGLSEQSPLLPPAEPHIPDEEPHIIPQLHSARAVVLLLAFGIFVIMCGNFLILTPSLRIYEDIICHHYYDNIKGEGHVALTADIDEELCKIDEIQRELAVVVGGLGIGESIPSLIFAIPYGILGDRIGRKSVFGLGLVGVLLSQAWIMLVCWFWQIFPLRLIWLNPISQSIGGGSAVIHSMAYAAISDVSTDADRTNHFFLAGCGVMAAEFFSPPIASVLMLRSPWIPFFIGFGVMILGGVCIVFVPETLHRRPRNGSIELAIDISDTSSTSSHFSMSPTKTTVLSKAKAEFSNTIKTLRSHASVPLLLLLATFLIQLLSRQTIDLVLRYISKRFKWSLAQTGPLLSIRALVNVILFLAILPGLSYLLTSENSRYCIRLNLSTQFKDLVLARISLIIQIVGAALLALSAFPSPTSDASHETAFPITLAIMGLVVYTFGVGFSFFCRSLITSIVEQHHVARLYSVISVIEVIGALIASPGLAWLYSWGISLAGKGMGQEFIGLPFLGVILFTIVAGGGIMFVKLPERNSEDTGEGYTDNNDEE